MFQCQEGKPLEELFLSEEQEQIFRGIRSLRQARGLSQSELGRQLGLSRQTVSRYEKQGQLPRGEPLRKLCRVLDCELWQLFHPDPVWAQKILKKMENVILITKAFRMPLK